MCPRIDESEMRPASENVEHYNNKKFEQRKLKVHGRKEGIVEKGTAHQETARSRLSRPAR